MPVPGTNTSPATNNAANIRRTEARFGPWPFSHEIRRAILRAIQASTPRVGTQARYRLRKGSRLWRLTWLIQGAP